MSALLFSTPASTLCSMGLFVLRYICIIFKGRQQNQETKLSLNSAAVIDPFKCVKCVPWKRSASEQLVYRPLSQVSRDQLENLGKLKMFCLFFLTAEEPVRLLSRERAALQLAVIRRPSHWARQDLTVKSQSSPHVPDSLLHPADCLPALQEAAQRPLQTGLAVQRWARTSRTPWTFSPTQNRLLS